MDSGSTSQSGLRESVPQWDGSGVGGKHREVVPGVGKDGETRRVDVDSLVGGSVDGLGGCPDPLWITVSFLFPSFTLVIRFDGTSQIEVGIRRKMSHLKGTPVTRRTVDGSKTPEVKWENIIKVWSDFSIYNNRGYMYVPLSDPPIL